eukprot:Protomagalhaensia_wolfi_Nauph_80__1677@NODE_2038_length_1237_cov_256_043406_g1593_i0_p1_GENE_NODE_2038_length_1237_cov_256_043406_g1593_i0NODE_2038_length_1237_cov_256_043406_g1593_i0_p1_ORF_typecomplete_len199_score17_62_NODE_2038_length_1237_cov_256_043406_g1593_i05951191
MHLLYLELEYMKGKFPKGVPSYEELEWQAKIDIPKQMFAKDIEVLKIYFPPEQLQVEASHCYNVAVSKKGNLTDLYIGFLGSGRYSCQMGQLGPGRPIRVWRVHPGLVELLRNPADPKHIFRDPSDRKSFLRDPKQLFENIEQFFCCEAVIQDMVIQCQQWVPTAPPRPEVPMWFGGVCYLTSFILNFFGGGFGRLLG